MHNEKYVSDVPLKSIPVKRIGLKVRDTAITNPKIAEGAVTTNKIADGAVGNSKIADGAVTANKLADGSIPGSKLTDGTISGSKIEIGSLPGSKIKDGTVSGDKIQDGALSRDKFAPEAIAEIDALTREATEATAAANTAAEGASRVNAEISGTTVTITNREGVSTSVGIGFEIYKTYASVAAMNADAVNVPEGKFVIIATTDPLSTDNAKLYCKNNQGGFSFVSDLDQASSEAWADWLNNCKPQIEQAVARVDSMEIGMVEATGEVYVEYEETSNS